MRRTTIPSITSTTRTLIRPIAACATTAPAYHNAAIWILGTFSLRRLLRRGAQPPGIYSSAQGTTLEPLRGQLPLLINSDPPDHSRLRHLADRLFTRSAVAPLEEAIQALTRELLRTTPGEGPDRHHCRLAARLPMAVLCRLLGVPKQDEDMLRGWTGTVVHRGEGVFRDARGWSAGDASDLRLLRGRTCVVAPGSRRRLDLIASFIEAEATGRLSHEELLGYLYLLSIAGNETTTKLIGNIVCQLHRHPRPAATRARRPHARTAGRRRPRASTGPRR